MTARTMHAVESARYLPLFCIALILSLLPFLSAHAQSGGVNALSRAVVQVKAPDGTASGVLFERNGELMVLTNRHVAEGYTKFSIGVLENVNRPAIFMLIAQLHSFSPDQDVALLRVVSYFDGRPVDLPAMRCQRRSAGNWCLPDVQFEPNIRGISRGDEVSVLGYPGIGDNELIFSSGHIASVLYDEYEGVSMPIWFRTSAIVSSGNSGGMAFNQQGRMIGIPTMVRFETATATSLGLILSMEAVWAALQADNVLQNWDDFFPENDGLDLDRDPHFGTITLADGFRPDPTTVDVLAGGSNRIHRLGPGCIGFAGTAPDVSLEWNGGPNALHVYFRADRDFDDTTLIIRDPSGTWLCNDDGGTSTNPLDPAVTIDQPRTGTYLIWVGTYADTDLVNGTLHFSQTLNESF